jgi:uncharacterized lipoprotein YddW (UPF0748 family)
VLVEFYVSTGIGRTLDVAPIVPGRAYDVTGRIINRTLTQNISRQGEERIMHRSEFIKLLGLSTIGLTAQGIFFNSGLTSIHRTKRNIKNWAWITTNLEMTDDEWRKSFAIMRDAGIDAVLPEIFNSREAFYASEHLPVGGKWLERILPLAKREGLEVHAWMWSMPCNIPEIYEKHPEWYIVNGKGESSVVKPAYVDYYRFLCPSREEVQLFLLKRVTELAQYDELDGIHLDYIRLPDVIIADALQPRYNVIQDREYPEFDYCYCDVCRSKFKDQTGIDPLAMVDPSESDQWRQFRYDSITNLVNEKLIPRIKRYNKMATAAVFPNWRAVRQQWMLWNLDSFLPMLYHNFYYGDIEWIKHHTQKGIRALNGRAPLYSGLFIPELNPDELRQAFEVSLNAGAGGIVVFHANAMNENHWHMLKESVRNIRQD